jgi:hypothetical protein
MRLVSVKDIKSNKYWDGVGFNVEQESEAKRFYYDRTYIPREYIGEIKKILNKIEAVSQLSITFYDAKNVPKPQQHSHLIKI